MKKNNPTQHLIEEKIQEFREKYAKADDWRETGFTVPYVKAPLIDIENDFRQALLDISKQQAEDICVILDEIELKDENTSIEQWRHYKGIRNTIRDRYVKTK